MEDQDWLVRFAAVLGEREMDRAEIDLVLDLTRDVAHTTVRRYAPLCSYLLGAAAAGDDRGVRAAELAAELRAVLPTEAGDVSRG